ncbi:FAD-binding oxidoreductase [Isoptericola chiayiensis]|uniref:FAD-binding oxidoreductase n=1 Tax=Isoptericola chiayiensis TaxID=579446 RepID=A0ABP8YFW8_9MICO|nr:FAD-binding oxidoreductase [Isoptericola chiayiensis]NOW00283.1 FAD/FMN-containing dehydrogenase [Isoptericola chiayiensis]
MTTLTTLDGGTVGLGPELDALARDLTGTLVRAGDAEYDDARALWNAVTERRPAAIVRCATTEDVRRCVLLAAEHRLLVAVRAGGHNVAGTAGVDGGLVIDLGRMRDVVVDPVARTARVAGGARLGDLDAATQQHGLATPAGVFSDTGIGGLGLTGGIGWLRRRYGLTCDNIVGATLVTADGTVHEVDEHSDPALLRGLRGGGGNLGVVTELVLRLHPVGPEVYVGFVIHRADRALEVLRTFRDWTADLPDEVSAMAVLGAAPEDDAVPAELAGQPCVIVLACSTDLDRGPELLAPVRDLPDPAADLSGVMPYVELQQIFDADYPTGMRYYWRSLHLPQLSEEALRRAVDQMHRRPSALSTIDLWHLGGAMSRTAAPETVYGDRSAPFLVGIEANWTDAADDDANVRWARACAADLDDLSTGREYLNFPGFQEGGQGTLRAAHGEEAYEHLRALKRRLDPHNLFRLHQNVAP